MGVRDPGWKEFGSGIHDRKNWDPGPGINIPDAQHWIIIYYLFPNLVNEYLYMNPVFLLKLFDMPSELQEERDNARDMIEEAYQSYRSVSLLT